MSLIVTSSEQAQYTTPLTRGVEAYAKYQNHFTVPVKIPANAEVAVESVKLRRGPSFDIEGDLKLFRFFGELNDVGAATPLTKVDHNSMPIPIVPEEGIYGIEAWAEQLEEKFNEGYCNPEIWNNSTITRALSATGVGEGLDILQTQRGSASGKDQTAIVNPAHWVNPNYLSYPDGYEYGLLHVGDLMVRNIASTGTEGDLNDHLGSAILGGFPMGLVEGKWIFNTTNSSNFRVGLSRPQCEFYRGDELGDLKPGNGTLLPLGPQDGEYPAINPTTGRDQTDYFDYMVECNASDSSLITVYQTLYNPTSKKLEQTEVVYYDAANPIFKTKWNYATFNASYSRMAFLTQGDELSLWAVPTGTTFDATAVAMIDASISTRADRTFAPIGETRAALYPKLTVAKLNEDIGLEEYESHYYHTAVSGQNASSFAFPYYDKTTQNLTVGDDYYSNNRLARTDHIEGGGQVLDPLDRPHGLDQTMICDTKADYSQHFTNPSAAYTYQGEIGAGVTATGIGYEQALIVGNINPGNNGDYTEGEYSSNRGTGQANISRQLGFASLGYLNETNPDATTPAYVTGAGTAAITLSSTGTISYSTQTAFVRLPSLTLHSFNGNKSSISKIIYHVPKFTPDGRDVGNLFFAPGEKTYIKLNNTESFLLNNLDVQVVGVDEMPVHDLTGPTIVVLHVRESP